MARSTAPSLVSLHCTGCSADIREAEKRIAPSAKEIEWAVAITLVILGMSRASSKRGASWETDNHRHSAGSGELQVSWKPYVPTCSQGDLLAKTMPHQNIPPPSGLGVPAKTGVKTSHCILVNGTLVNGVLNTSYTFLLRSTWVRH